MENIGKIYELMDELESVVERRTFVSSASQDDLELMVRRYEIRCEIVKLFSFKD